MGKWSLLGVLLSSVAVFAQADQPAYQNTQLSFEERAKDLVSRMTIEEKIPQLINDAPAIPAIMRPTNSQPIVGAAAISA